MMEIEEDYQVQSISFLTKKESGVNVNEELAE